MNKPSKKAGKAGSLEEVVLFASTVGATERAARWFWYKNEGSGWICGRKEIKNWRACFIAWWEAQYFPPNTYLPPRVKQEDHKCIFCGTPWIEDGIGGWKYQCRCRPK